MKRRYLFPLLVLLLAEIGVQAQQKTVTIATVNNPEMIELKKLSSKFEQENPDIKLNWVILSENAFASALRRMFLKGAGNSMRFSSVYMKPRYLPSGGGCFRSKIYLTAMT